LRNLCAKLGEAVDIVRLADAPVLAKAAAEIATGGAERQHAGTRVEVVQRLLLDGVDAEPGTAPVRREEHPVPDPLANEAKPALAVLQLAVARAQVALDAAVVELVPPARRMFAAVEVVAGVHRFVSFHLETE
jgi:hypothetical protein